MTYESADHHPAFEEYSETIYGLVEDGVVVIQARIAKRLGVSRPAVSEMVRRMQREGLVEIGDRSEVMLTEAGRELATTVVRRHRLAERFLTDILQLDWTAAHEEAGRWEHVISTRVEDAMMRELGHPTTCPHGNPIPGSEYRPPAGTVALSEIKPGHAFTVTRIREELEFEDGQLAFLESSGLMPGRSGTVTSVAPDGTTTISINDSAIGVSIETAERIVVTN